MNSGDEIVIPYEQVDFIWISSHYDVHWTGICEYNGDLYSFNTEDITDYEEQKQNCRCCSHDDHPKCCRNNDYKTHCFCSCSTFDNLVCHLTRISATEKTKWLLRKKLFEICVGKHWTYPNRKNGEKFYYKSFFHKFVLYPLYYKWLNKL